MATLSMPSPSWADTEHPAATSATNVLAQPFPIARSYLLAVPFTDLGPFEEPAAASVGNNDIGVIAGEHDAVRTDDVECPLQVALAEYSSWRDEDVAANILRHRAAQIGDAGHPVDAFEVEQHHFAPMPQDQLQTGKPVEHPAQDEPKQLKARVVMPTQSVRCQCRVDSVAESAVVIRCSKRPAPPEAATADADTAVH